MAGSIFDVGTGAPEKTSKKRTGPSRWEKERAGIARTAGGLGRGLWALGKDVGRLTTPRGQGEISSFLPGGVKPREKLPVLASLLPATGESLKRTFEGLLEIAPTVFPGGKKPSETAIAKQASETSLTEAVFEHGLNVLGGVSAGASVARAGLGTTSKLAGAAGATSAAGKFARGAEVAAKLSTPMRSSLRAGAAAAASKGLPVTARGLEATVKLADIVSSPVAVTKVAAKNAALKHFAAITGAQAVRDAATALNKASPRLSLEQSLQAVEKALELRKLGAGVDLLPDIQTHLVRAETALAGGERAGLRTRALSPLGRQILAREARKIVKKEVKPIGAAQVSEARKPHVLAMRSAQDQLMKLPEMKTIPWARRKEVASQLVGDEITRRLTGVSLVESAGLGPPRKRLPDDPELNRWLNRAEELARQESVARQAEANIEIPSLRVPRKAVAMARQAQKTFKQGERLETKLRQVQRVASATGWEEGPFPLKARQEVLEAGAEAIRYKQASAKAWSEGESLMRKALTMTEGIDVVPVGSIPPVWQPMFSAIKDMRLNMRRYEKLGIIKPDEAAALFADIPDTFSKLMARAAEAGVHPVHVSDLTPSRVRQLATGNPVLGGGVFQTPGKTKVGRFRKSRFKVLEKKGLKEYSIESFIAEGVAVVEEARSNAVAQTIETNFARPMPSSGQVPDAVAKGWVPWSPSQPVGNWEMVLEGGQRVAKAPINATHVIPKEVDRTLKQWTFKPPPSGILGTFDKVQNSWRFVLLNLSPRWYINGLAGNLMLSTTAGVGLRDWARAIQAMRKSEIEGQRIAGVNLRERVRPIKGVEMPEAIPGELVKAGLGREATSPLSQFAERLGLPPEGIARLNTVVDELARTAVFFHGLRKGMNTEQAVERALKALVDYSDLSPLERAIGRRVIPFYSWQKGILKLTGSLPVDHPLRVLVYQKISSISGGFTEEERKTYPDYLFATIPLSGGRLASTRGANPFQDALALTTPEGIRESLSPFAELLIRSIFNVPEQGFAENYTVNPIGIAEPDVTVREGLLAIFRDLPILRAVAGELPEKQQFFGANIRNPEKIRKAIARTARARRQQGIPAPVTGAGNDIFTVGGG